MNGFFRFISWGFLSLVLAFVAFAVYSGLTSDVSTTRASSAPVVEPAEREHIVTITSDPPGASVFMDGETYLLYTTPAEVALSEGRHGYRIAFEDYETESNLYKPYRGKLNVIKDESISVWLDRRTQVEIDELQAADRAEAEAAYAAAEAEIDSERAYYRIETSCAYGANLTYMNADGNITQQSNMGNDWYYYFVPEPGQYLSLSAQNQCDEGYITVKIVQLEVTLEENTSTGAYVIASVSGSWN